MPPQPHPRAKSGRSRSLCYLLTPGQAAGCRHAETLLDDVAFACLIGDRAYDTEAIRARAVGRPPLVVEGTRDTLGSMIVMEFR